METERIQWSDDLMAKPWESKMWPKAGLQRSGKLLGWGMRDGRFGWRMNARASSTTFVWTFFPRKDSDDAAVVAHSSNAMNMQGLIRHEQTIMLQKGTKTIMSHEIWHHMAVMLSVPSEPACQLGQMEAASESKNPELLPQVFAWSLVGHCFLLLSKRCPKGFKHGRWIWVEWLEWLSLTSLISPQAFATPKDGPKMHGCHHLPYRKVVSRFLWFSN